MHSLSVTRSSSQVQDTGFSSRQHGFESRTGYQSHLFSERWLFAFLNTRLCKCCIGRNILPEGHMHYHHYCICPCSGRLDSFEPSNCQPMSGFNINNRKAILLISTMMMSFHIKPISAEHSQNKIIEDYDACTTLRLSL